MRGTLETYLPESGPHMLYQQVLDATTTVNGLWNRFTERYHTEVRSASARIRTDEHFRRQVWLYVTTNGTGIRNEASRRKAGELKQAIERDSSAWNDVIAQYASDMTVRALHGDGWDTDLRTAFTATERALGRYCSQEGTPNWESLPDHRTMREDLEQAVDTLRTIRDEATAHTGLRHRNTYSSIAYSAQNSSSTIEHYLFRENVNDACRDIRNATRRDGLFRAYEKYHGLLTELREKSQEAETSRQAAYTYAQGHRGEPGAVQKEGDSWEKAEENAWGYRQIESALSTTAKNHNLHYTPWSSATSPFSEKSQPYRTQPAREHRPNLWERIKQRIPGLDGLSYETRQPVHTLNLLDAYMELRQRDPNTMIPSPEISDLEAKIRASSSRLPAATESNRYYLVRIYNTLAASILGGNPDLRAARYMVRTRLQGYKPRIGTLERIRRALSPQPHRTQPGFS